MSGVNGRLPRSREAVARLGAHFETQWILLVLVALIAMFTCITPRASFLSFQNLQDLALDASEILILALGETFLLVSGGLDMSVGSVVVFTAVVTAKLMVQLSGTPAQEANLTYPSLGLALAISIPAGILAGVAWGAINGFLTVWARVPPFIVTMGTMTAALGLAEVWTGGYNVSGVPLSVQNNFGLAKLAGAIPLPVVVAVVVAILCWMLLHRTRFGMRTFAVGANLEAARRVGISINVHRFLLYVLMGGLAGLVGVIDVARFDTASIGSHTMDPLSAIAAVVIGGTSLFGGRGSIGGTVIGALIPVVLADGFVIVGINPFWQNVAIGFVLISAVYIDQMRRRRAR